MGPEKREAPPGGSGAPLKSVAAGKCDGSDLNLDLDVSNLDLDVSQLVRRDVRPDEIPELRSLWWRQARAGHRLPAEIDVIVICGGER